MATATGQHAELPSPPQSGSRCRWPFRRSRTAWLVSCIAALALLPRLLTAGRFVTVDEGRWMTRSMRFSDALISGDLGRASADTESVAETMPGVTTMWIGSLARGLWTIGPASGLWGSSEGEGFLDSQSALEFAQTTAAVVTSALIALVVFLTARWVGLTPAAVVGVLLATEPFIVAHGALLHTDALVALFGMAALLATSLALGLPRETPWTGTSWAAAVAGGLWGAAFLTKLSALNLLPGVAVLFGWALVAAREQRRRAPHPDDVTAAETPNIGATWSVMLWWVTAALMVIVAAYPALWVQPTEQLRMLWDSAGLATEGHTQFFLGNRTEDPGPAYYAVALPLRVTPWFLIAGVLGGVAVFAKRATRRFGFALLCMAVPPFVSLTVAAKKFDRYGLQILVVAAIAVGIVVSSALDRVERRAPSPRYLPLVGVAVAALLVGHSVAVAPWGLAYFNPALGGGATAERAILIGWGEGLEQAGKIIEERASGPCADVTIWSYRVSRAFPCGKLRPASRADWDFVVIYVNQRQRSYQDFLAGRIGDRVLIDEVEIRGITYAEIYAHRE